MDMSVFFRYQDQNKPLSRISWAGINYAINELKHFRFGTGKTPTPKETKLLEELKQELEVRKVLKDRIDTMMSDGDF